MFAREAIKKGAVVVVWGGVILRKADIQAGNFKRGSLSAIAEDVWLGDPPDAQDDDANYTNHSCDPNLWMKDEVTLIAKRDIEVGEELTADYILWGG
jgi:SET domain-containing protein